MSNPYPDYKRNVIAVTNGELVRAWRTDQQIVDQTEELAVWLLSWCFNHQPETETPMRQSTHPFAERCWAAACHIQEMLTDTDPMNAVAEVDVELDAAQQASVTWLPADDSEGGLP